MEHTLTFIYAHIVSISFVPHTVVHTCMKYTHGLKLRVCGLIGN